jgi:hypothetical protein
MIGQTEITRTKSTEHKKRIKKKNTQQDEDTPRRG